MLLKNQLLLLHIIHKLLLQVLTQHYQKQEQEVKPPLRRIQVLHSKFGDAGDLNPGFRAGSIRVLIRSIRALP